MKDPIRAGSLVKLNKNYSFHVVEAWGVGLVLRTYTDIHQGKRAVVRWFGSEFIENPGIPGELEHETVTNLKVISK